MRPNQVETAVHGCNSWFPFGLYQAVVPLSFLRRNQPCFIVMKNKERKGARGAMRKKIVLSTIQVLFLMLKRFLYKLMPTKYNHVQPKCEIKIPCPRKLSPPPPPPPSQLPFKYWLVPNSSLLRSRYVYRHATLYELLLLLTRHKDMVREQGHTLSPLTSSFHNRPNI